MDEVRLAEEIRKCGAEGVLFNQAATEEQLRDVESRLRGSLSGVHRAFLRIANGMSQASWGAEIVTLWSVERFEEVFVGGRSGASDVRRFIAFADHMVESHLYVMEPDGVRRVWGYDGSVVRPLGCDVDRFLWRVLCADEIDDLLFW